MSDETFMEKVKEIPSKITDKVKSVFSSHDDKKPHEYADHVSRIDSLPGDAYSVQKMKEDEIDTHQPFVTVVPNNPDKLTGLPQKTMYTDVYPQKTEGLTDIHRTAADVHGPFVAHNTDDRRNVIHPNQAGWVNAEVIAPTAAKISTSPPKTDQFHVVPTAGGFTEDIHNRPKTSFSEHTFMRDQMVPGEDKLHKEKEVPTTALPKRNDVFQGIVPPRHDDGSDHHHRKEVIINGIVQEPKEFRGIGDRTEKLMEVHHHKKDVITPQKIENRQEVPYRAEGALGSVHPKEKDYSKELDRPSHERVENINAPQGETLWDHSAEAIPDLTGKSSKAPNVLDAFIPQNQHHSHSSGAHQTGVLRADGLSGDVHSHNSKGFPEHSHGFTENHQEREGFHGHHHKDLTGQNKNDGFTGVVHQERLEVDEMPQNIEKLTGGVQNMSTSDKDALVKKTVNEALINCGHLAGAVHKEEMFKMRPAH